jgi:murein DD-endopeptidase MepM/ murein hydrolase activator NlpD
MATHRIGRKSSAVSTLMRASAVIATFILAVPASSSGESRSREETVDRVIGTAVGAVLNGGLRHPEETAKGVAVGELERILMERARERERQSRRYPEPSREPQSRPYPERRDPAPRYPDRYGWDLVMPVVGVEFRQVSDSYGDPRSGGRSHRGVDIFAPRWTEVVAVTWGRIDSIGNGGLGGRTIWLRGEDGRSYYYAHLEDWARGLRQGMSVSPGQLIGYVGNSGNAATTPTHLHFEVRDGRGGSVNPYYVLADARPSHRANDGAILTAAAAPRRSLWDRIWGR